jgi:hypothetical protein
MESDTSGDMDFSGVHFPFTSFARARDGAETAPSVARKASRFEEEVRTIGSSVPSCSRKHRATSAS